MLEFETHLLSLLVFLPLLWSILGLLIPTGSKAGEKLMKSWVFIGSLLTFFFSILLFLKYQDASAIGDKEFYLSEVLPWIPFLGIQYAIGVDGISLWLVLLTSFLMPITILGSFQAVQNRVKEFYFLLLSLETAMLGAFVSLDVFLFYVFWEAMLIPMYFLIGIWGGKERIYAAMKFFLYTLVGSLLMLVAIFYLASQYKYQFGKYSTFITDLYQLNLSADGLFSVQNLLFLAFSFAFAIKVPLFPFHTWLPDAHVQAPTAGSVILAAILLKMGGYGFIRFGFPLFPQAVHFFQIPFMILASIAIVYGAWLALVQSDVKKLVAYSSVSHMGYVVLGLFSLDPLAVTGSIYQMLNHGISTGGLFLLVGMIYERRHTREISEFGGITKVMPIFAISLMIMTLSSLALPGTNGFVGEFLILLGSWKTNPLLTAISALGVIFGAVYMLWMFQKTMFGPIHNPENKKLMDLSWREKLVMLPLVFAVFFMGIFPNFFFERMETPIQRLLSRTSAINHLKE